MSQERSGPVTRRSFLGTAAKTGVAAGAVAAAPQFLTASARAASPQGGMNILVVIVDQLRTPWVYLSPRLQRKAIPSISRLADEGVRFSNYYTSSNDCTPSRTTQATGLYTHQTAIFATTPPTDLNPGFPTWGTMLRQNGYDTYWFGKWHMSGDQNGGCEPNPYESYGFTADWPGSGTCPSPNGGPGQGQAMDPVIRQQFRDWLAARPTGGNPWATTVSFVNPHDIAWYPRWTRGVEGQSQPPSVFTQPAANFETTAERRARRKPEMQRRAQQIENESFGLMPADETPTRPWVKMLDTYLLMQNQVDIQVGLVLKALARSPFADNTIVVFCSDHGEYGGAHGMRGKGFAFYEEGIRVPLIVKDPTGGWTKATRLDRRQLIESVDLAPLLLTLGTGNDNWRGNSAYAQIAGRADVASMLTNPSARGRAYIAHATDEPGTSSRIPTSQQLRPAPNHITAVRTEHGKFARYAFWKDGTLELDESKPIQYEAYNYASRSGRMELDNIYDKRGSSRADKALVRRLDRLLDKAMTDEIQQTLPVPLQPIQQQAFTDWFSQPPVDFTADTDN
ncbi:sulfatase-like hydrolase/transferase [Conexibacter sp. CPCC 206217]|uniref:sulfatase-like hydrolase/transferase n=1 Tax=Conexibacter sp. CPCC 206217 TaxID=3064574 RepID=UPI002721C642|nr:sulfatase-like hydrolase/transferase [Conexibacter sp. CPCC 206217]MDO8210644.1 sulfatase-like hydrolase/transferase [Conexibacter sp. CPCC 206217]